MNILITGSSGQIGTNLALRLIKQGRRVLGLDRRENDWTDEIPFLQLDLAADDIESALSVHGGFDVVVHLAAYAKVHELVLHPDRAMENITDTFNILEFCRRHKTPIIFGSSREVYGDIHRHQTDETHADFVVAESPYSAGKIAGEALIYSYARCYGLPYIVFRFSNVYGRYDNDLERMERVIPLFINKIALGEPITVFGKEKIFDFTYVDDCVAGVSAGIENLVSRNVKNETFNLAKGEGHSLLDLVEYIKEALGKDDIDIAFEPARPGEVLRYIADIGKARSLLGYDPQVSLPEGIKRTVAWGRERGDIPR